jgi:hypothetical protein
MPCSSSSYAMFHADSHNNNRDLVYVIPPLLHQATPRKGRLTSEALSENCDNAAAPCENIKVFKNNAKEGIGD